MPEHDRSDGPAGGIQMGIVISFPANQRMSAGPESTPREAGQVIILPVIRVERLEEQPTVKLETPPRTPARKRRRRVLQS